MESTVLEMVMRYLLMLESGERVPCVSKDLAPILERLQISRETWVDCIQNFGRWFGWAVGKEKALVNERDQSGQHRIRGRSQAAVVFG